MISLQVSGVTTAIYSSSLMRLTVKTRAILSIISDVLIYMDVTVNLIYQDPLFAAEPKSEPRHYPRSVDPCSHP